MWKPRMMQNKEPEDHWKVTRPQQTFSQWHQGLGKTKIQVDKNQNTILSGVEAE